ncbi:histidine kinase [Chitinophaga varians]|uniref:Histidine kinase n=1 Tax=Chitinophaga varians TaxID=2202339 RepID=A0A847RIU1_9BACT|nr:sensor histidine kinase [Chitinophaga varians]NLR63013.1 histidine kinase [Chitinophaga varians]
MQTHSGLKTGGLPLIYEITIWVLYVGTYKYAYYVDRVEIAHNVSMFPYPQVAIYALAMSLYWLLYYRAAVPWILRHKKHWLLLIAILLFVLVLSIPNNYFVTWIFMQLNGQEELHRFYASEFAVYARRMAYGRGWSMNILAPDLIAFSSVAFLRYAIESEQRNWQMERQNYQLKIDALRAKINPHFLFNTLNSVYGMTLLGKKDAPDFILRMSDAMRYILYESSAERVLLEKEVAFIESYFAIENQRLGNVRIRFASQGIDSSTMIAPLILLPFIENAIKHGAQHFRENAQIDSKITLQENRLYFEIANDVHDNPDILKGPKGVGMENVRARLELCYPGKYILKIDEGNKQYKVYLSIDLNLS